MIPWPAPRLRSVRLRLTLWNVGVLAFTLIALGAALRYAVQQNLLRSMDQDMERHAQMMSEDHGPPPGLPPPGLSPLGLPPLGLDSLGLLGPHPHHDHPAGGFGPRILGLDGRGLHPDHPAFPWDPETFRLAARGQTVATTVSYGAKALRVLALPIRREGRVVGVVQDVRPLDAVTQEVNRLTRTLLTLIPLALLAAALGGSFLTDRALRPVRDITRAAGRISAENLSGRLPVAGDDELAALAITFNAMLARLEAAFEQQRRFTADASHELRTPLTVIKANTSLALAAPRDAAGYREALEAVDHAADRTGRLVQDLLLLARADTGQTGFARTPTPLDDVLEQAVATVCAPDSPKIRLERNIPNLCVLGDADALARLFSNLLANAVRHTPAEGQITITAAPQGGRAVVTVADTGEGIAPEHLPHVFERFYRADAARSSRQGGTGLGLAICKSIVDAHGGEISIESAAGRGATVRVTLPCA
ncbi:MAG: HAMP domain-containing protein [Armatimonadetes bacterium]|nr:HAMP domain-containing protein [Armatimonadota bacterium]